MGIDLHIHISINKNKRKINFNLLSINCKFLKIHSQGKAQSCMRNNFFTIYQDFLRDICRVIDNLLNQVVSVSAESMQYLLSLMEFSLGSLPRRTTPQSSILVFLRLRYYNFVCFAIINAPSNPTLVVSKKGQWHYVKLKCGAIGFWIYDEPPNRLFCCTLHKLSFTNVQLTQLAEISQVTHSLLSYVV